jgi:hypothetical protein
MSAVSESTETIIIDLYPWPVPTEDQKAWFDALPTEEKRRVLANAIEDGFNSGETDLTPMEIAARLVRGKPG